MLQEQGELLLLRRVLWFRFFAWGSNTDFEWSLGSLFGHSTLNPTWAGREIWSLNGSRIEHSEILKLGKSCTWSWSADIPVRIKYWDFWIIFRLVPWVDMAYGSRGQRWLGTNDSGVSIGGRGQRKRSEKDRCFVNWYLADRNYHNSQRLWLIPEALVYSSPTLR